MEWFPPTLLINFKYLNAGAYLQPVTQAMWVPWLTSYWTHRPMYSFFPLATAESARCPAPSWPYKWVGGESSSWCIIYLIAYFLEWKPTGLRASGNWQPNSQFMMSANPCNYLDVNFFLWPTHSRNNWRAQCEKTTVSLELEIARHWLSWALLNSNAICRCQFVQECIHARRISEPHV